MTTTTLQLQTAHLEQLIAKTEAAWNAADGAAFAAVFTDDADFVNVYGMHARGREAIAAGHHFIFTTIYRGSEVRYRIVSMRELAPSVVLLHVAGKLAVPSGNMAGSHDAMATAVALLTPDGWKLAAYQNTHVQVPPTTT